MVALGATWGIAALLRAAISWSPSSKVFWVNARWVTTSIFVLGLPAVFAVALILGAWMGAAFILLTHLFYGSVIIRQIELRYLFFRDPVGNNALLDELEEGERGQVRYLRRLIEGHKDAYFRLPRAILRSSAEEVGSDAG